MVVLLAISGLLLAQQPAPDLILSNGKIITVDERFRIVQAVAIQGDRIVAEALRRFPVKRALCIHRVGSLGLGEMAVWVGVSSAHRGEAFDACRFIIDAVKHRVPIWKKEHYRNGNSGWVNCERCAAEPQHPPEHRHRVATAPKEPV